MAKKRRRTYMTKAKYRRYLRTKHWQKVRLRRLALAGYACEQPGCKVRTGLEVHHLHYSTLRAEKDSDLEVLCREHHQLRHSTPKVTGGRGSPARGPRSP